MTWNLTVRPAERDDANDVYEVMRQSRRSAFDGLLPPAALDWDSEVPAAFREFVHSTVAREGSTILVAVCEEAVVGVVELAWQSGETQDFVEDHEAELRAIHVRPANRNEGIGTRLLDAAVDALPSTVSGVALCVLAGNELAQAFYERRGFEQTGTTVTTHAGEERTEAVYRRPLG